jgi:phospholipid/cholesterol/gamma-HCH transport system substrate-binding protein
MAANPRLLAAAKDLLNNLGSLTGADSALDSTHAQRAGRHRQAQRPGRRHGLADGRQQRSRLLVERANALLVTADQLARRTDGRWPMRPTRVFGRAS